MPLSPEARNFIRGGLALSAVIAYAFINIAKMPDVNPDSVGGANQALAAPEPAARHENVFGTDFASQTGALVVRHVASGAEDQGPPPLTIARAPLLPLFLRPADY